STARCLQRKWRRQAPEQVGWALETREARTRRERKHGATAARDPLRQRTKPKSTETALLTLRHVAMHITPMDSQTLTLRELSDQVGIEPRTIRSYIQQGLLRGPEGLGPKAKYGPYHL